MVGKHHWEVMFLDGSSQHKKSNVLTIEEDRNFDEEFSKGNKIGRILTSAEYRTIIDDPFGESSNCLVNPVKILNQFYQRPLDEGDSSDDDDEDNTNRSVCSEESLRFFHNDHDHDSDSGDEPYPVSRNPHNTTATKTNSTTARSTSSSKTTTTQQTSSTSSSTQSSSQTSSTLPPSSEARSFLDENKKKSKGS